VEFDLRQIFLDEGRLFEVEVDQPLIVKGEVRGEIFLVVSGQIALRSSSVLGREFVIDIIKTGELFGFGVLAGQTQRNVDAVALTFSRIAALDFDRFKAWLLADPRHGMEICRIVAQFLMRRTRQIEDIATMQVSSRLAKKLLSFAQEQGVTADEGGTFRCDYSQSLIGMLIGVSRETVSRQIQKWEEIGLIAHSGKNISIMNPALLKRIADGFSEPE
jgi:CRP/FNR family transcriptional regulator